ncbi:MAG: alpha/beta hydrolase, partial [Verrucomicrobiales bacterium]
GLMGGAMAEEWKPLWPGDAPGAARPVEGTEKIGDGWRYENIEQPEYVFYQAPETRTVKRTGQGVVIFPGGGYTLLAMDHEGHDYAKWLNDRGVSAMVVKYRVSRDPLHGYQFPVPYLDARRAIRTMRAHAKEWGIDPEQVGVMGSSAGGHLASVCATEFGESFEEEGGDEIDGESCRPDFAILIYPVISMGPLAHSGSRKRLLGEDPNPESVGRLSAETRVSSQTPPCFLLTTSDDGVDCRNSLLFAAACKDQGVPVTLHLFESGGHGYGLKGKGSVRGWPALLEAWLRR